MDWARMNWDEQVGTAEDVRWVFETMPIMLAALRGPDHRLIALNEAYRRFIPKAAASGLPAREVFPEVLGQFLFDAFDRVFQTGETQYGKEWRVAIDLEGSGLTRDTYWDFTLAARRDGTGAIDGIDLVLREVTARVRARLSAEARLSEVSERYERMRSATTVMQAALLASSVPVLPGADVAAEYLVATEDTAAGGDWFDAIATTDGALLLVVGDVVGHGVDAAAVMAQLRTAVRFELCRGAGIGETLEAVDGFSAIVPGSKFATLCIARLDVARGTLEYLTAGHPPPMVIAGGVSRFLEPTGGSPLGGPQSRATKTETLGIGDAVLLYTDGILERPGRPMRESTIEFAAVATRALAGEAIPDNVLRPVERLCAQTLELLLRNTGYGDDVTLLAAQRTPMVAPLRIRVAADDRASPEVRARIRQWLGTVGADHTDTMIVEHAVSEYVQNSADHAYDGTVGSISVDATLNSDGTLHVTVADQGTWRPKQPGAEPSRGLNFVSTLIDTARINPGDDGTRGHIAYRLQRPARIVTDPEIVPVAHRRPSDTDFAVHVDEDGVMIVAGDVDANHAPALAGRITGHSRSGTMPLTLDLSAATHLGSSALRLLAEAHTLARDQHTDLVFIAPPGSTAHHVLTLVGLPTSAGSP